MNAVNFASLVRQRTKTDSTTFPDATLLLMANAAKDRIALRIADQDEDYFGTPAYTDLFANQREYPLPDDILGKIKRVEAALDGVNYLKLSELDLSVWPRGTTETDIVNTFSNDEGNVYYDIFRNALWLYSGAIIDVENGIKLWYIANPPDLTSLAGTSDLSADPSTTTAGIPRSLHDIWATMTAVDWKTSRDRPLPLTEREQRIDDILGEAVDSLSAMNLDRTVLASLPPSSTRGYDGQEY